MREVGIDQRVRPVAQRRSSAGYEPNQGGAFYHTLHTLEACTVRSDRTNAPAKVLDPAPGFPAEKNRGLLPADDTAEQQIAHAKKRRAGVHATSLSVYSLKRVWLQFVVVMHLLERRATAQDTTHGENMAPRYNKNCEPFSSPLKRGLIGRLAAPRPRPTKTKNPSCSFRM